MPPQCPFFCGYPLFWRVTYAAAPDAMYEGAARVMAECILHQFLFLFGENVCKPVYSTAQHFCLTCVARLEGKVESSGGEVPIEWGSEISIWEGTWEHIANRKALLVLTYTGPPYPGLHLDATKRSCSESAACVSPFLFCLWFFHRPQPEENDRQGSAGNLLEVSPSHNVSPYKRRL